MKKTIASIAWVILLCAGFAACRPAQADDQGCVKVRCSNPTCFRQNAGGYFQYCPNGDSKSQPQQPADKHFRLAAETFGAY
jgi:hypothetical protein